jgi:phytoene synthase
MNPQEALAACEVTVRQSDPDRYFAGLFAPADKRPMLFALYAFNHELARAAEVARESVMAEIRLQWWRDALDDAWEGRPRAQPAAVGLTELVRRGAISTAALHALIDARSEEIGAAPFPNVTALEAHLEATSGALIRLAAAVLDPQAAIEEVSREAGIAYGLAGIIRAIPFHAARDKSFLPADLLAAERLNPNDVLSLRHGNAARRIVSRLADVARAHFDHAKRAVVPKKILPALLPAALVPAYLSSATRGRKPLREPKDISLFRRQFILLRAATLGRL